MKRISFFKRLKGSIRANRVNIACVFMIALLTLTGACAKQTPPSMYLAFKLPVKGEPEKDESNNNQEIVCRSIVHKKIKSGTKYCGTKAQLAHLDETGMVSEKDESENGKSNDDQKIVCRFLEDKGTKKRTKYCAAKALWAYACVCDSENCGCNDDSIIVCRTYVRTGTKLTSKYCKSKTLWAEWDRINSRFAKNLVLKVSREAATIGDASDESGP